MSADLDQQQRVYMVQKELHSRQGLTSLEECGSSKFAQKVERAYGYVALNTQYGSVVQQLGDPVTMAHSGHILDQPHNAPFTKLGESTVLQSLLEVWTGLADQENCIVLQEWIQDKILTDTQECVSFLNTLVNFNHLLPKEALIYLYNSKNPAMYEKPFYALSFTIVGARARLETNKSNSPSLPLLEEAYDTLVNKMNILHENDMYDQSRGLVRWISEAQQFLPLQEQAMGVVCYMRSLKLSSEAARNYVSDLERSGVIDTVLSQSILLNALRSNLITGGPEEYTSLCEQTIDMLTDDPFVDASAIEYSDRIPKGTHKVRFWVNTGTYLAHLSHAEYLAKLQLHIASQRQPGVVDFMLILPNLVPGIAQDGATKPVDHSGYHYERIELLIAHLAHLDKSNLLMTTDLQPRPEESLRGRVRIPTAINRITSKIEADLQAAGRLPDLEYEDIRCVGADEFDWEAENGHLKLADRQHPRFDDRSVVVVTGPYIPRMIPYSQHVVDRLGNGCTLIFCPDILGQHSSDAIKAFRKTGDLSAFTPAAWTLVEQGWSNERTSERSLNPVETEILSITDINQNVIDKLRRSLGY